MTGSANPLATSASPRSCMSTNGCTCGGRVGGREGGAQLLAACPGRRTRTSAGRRPRARDATRERRRRVRRPGEGEVRPQHAARAGRQRERVHVGADEVLARRRRATRDAQPCRRSDGAPPRAAQQRRGEVDEDDLGARVARAEEQPDPRPPRSRRRRSVAGACFTKSSRDAIRRSTSRATGSAAPAADRRALEPAPRRGAVEPAVARRSRSRTPPRGDSYRSLGCSARALTAAHA